MAFIYNCFAVLKFISHPLLQPNQNAALALCTLPWHLTPPYLQIHHFFRLELPPHPPFQVIPSLHPQLKSQTKSPMLNLLNSHPHRAELGSPTSVLPLHPPSWRAELAITYHTLPKTLLSVCPSRLRCAALHGQTLCSV